MLHTTSLLNHEIMNNYHFPLEANAMILIVLNHNYIE